MVVVVAAEHAKRALGLLDAGGERASRIGAIVARPAGEPATVVV
jgi:phosphoribosylaminoimidazole (AIR) synthetase